MKTERDNSINDKARRIISESPELQKDYERQKRIANFARLIREWRINAGLTQQELAEAIKTKQSAISRLESIDSDKFPAIPTLIEIAHACGGELAVGALNDLIQHRHMDIGKPQEIVEELNKSIEELNKAKEELISRAERLKKELKELTATRRRRENVRLSKMADHQIMDIHKRTAETVAAAVIATRGKTESNNSKLLIKSKDGEPQELLYDLF